MTMGGLDGLGCLGGLEGLAGVGCLVGGLDGLGSLRGLGGRCLARSLRVVEASFFMSWM